MGKRGRPRKSRRSYRPIFADDEVFQFIRMRRKPYHDSANDTLKELLGFGTERSKRIFTGK